MGGRGNRAFRHSFQIMSRFRSASEKLRSYVLFCVRPSQICLASLKWDVPRAHSSRFYNDGLIYRRGRQPPHGRVQSPRAHKRSSDTQCLMGRNAANVVPPTASRDACVLFHAGCITGASRAAGRIVWSLLSLFARSV